MYYERPRINGKPTFRSLETNHEKTARQTLAQNQLNHAKSKVGAAPDPYAKKVLTTTGDIIRRYIADNCPDRRRAQRPIQARKAQKRACEMLLGYWDNMPIENVNLQTMDSYCDHRLKQIRASKIIRGPGHTTIDSELGALSNAFTWAVRCGLAKYNPVYGQRVKYVNSRDVKHCREFMPRDAEELHAIARRLFTSDIRTVVCGWQYLFEAFTGVRTQEALRLRADAAPGQPGHIIVDKQTGAWKQIEMSRCKGGVNPYIAITPELRQLLDALFQWRKIAWPESPWYFPGYNTSGKSPANKATLGKNLHASRKHLGRKLTSHGARAYFVTAWRSWGKSDVEISIMIGHRGGPQLLSTTYGAVPTNWLQGDGPKMTWIPTTGDPAWTVLNLPSQSNIVTLPNQKIA